MRPALIRTKDVAAMLGLRLPSFYRRRAALEAAGFPGPVTACGLRWDPVAIDAWLAGLRAPAPAPDPHAVPAADDVAAWQTELDRRLQGPRP